MDKTVEILLAEDNLADVVLFREALSSTSWDFRLHVAHDGMETLDFLRQRNTHSGAPRPDLVVMDNNMPRKSGLEVLTEVMSAPSLSDIPVIIMSGSEWERSMVTSFGIPEDRYIVKPVTFSGYLDVARQIESIWRKTANR
ncbi:MAG: response regulator [Victivallales bacterium]|jgi:CheY-like chemotaxis protein